MKKKSNHWRTNIVALLAILLFVAAGLAVVFGYATFTEASSLLSMVAMPLIYVGFKLSADSKAVEQNQYPNP